MKIGQLIFLSALPCHAARNGQKSPSAATERGPAGTDASSIFVWDGLAPADDLGSGNSAELLSRLRDPRRSFCRPSRTLSDLHDD